MKKVSLAEKKPPHLRPAKLQDLGSFETKMARIKEIKALRQHLDKSFLVAAIDALELQGKKISAKRVKAICKKALADMIDEVKHEHK